MAKYSTDDVKAQLIALLGSPRTDAQARAEEIELREMIVGAEIAAHYAMAAAFEGAGPGWKERVRKTQRPASAAEETIQRREREALEWPQTMATMLQELRDFTGDDDVTWAARLGRIMTRHPALPAPPLRSDRPTTASAGAASARRFPVSPRDED